MLNSQIQYPGYEINRSYGQATCFLGYSLPGRILIYDQENRFLGNVFIGGGNDFPFTPALKQRRCFKC